MLVTSIGFSEEGVTSASIIEHAPVSIIMSDPGGRIVLVNKAAESLFGYDRSELIGQPIELLVPLPSRSIHPDHRASYQKNPTLRTMGLGRELYAIHKSGAEIPVEIGLRPVQMPEGDFVLSTIMDTTERKRGEQVTARLAAIIKTAHIAMIAYTTDGTITDWNPAAEQLYEFGEREMVGQSIYRLIPPELESETREMMLRISRGETFDYLETDRLRKSGSRVRVSLTLSPIQSESGAIIGISSIARDITQRVALEGQLRRANEQLAERTERLAAQARQLTAANHALEISNEELQQFAYVVSHDLQAPLRSVNGFLQLLSDDYSDRLDDQAHEWIQRVLDSVARLQALIRDLLSYARVDSRREKFEATDLAAVFDATVALFERTIAELGARVTRDQLPIVDGDPAQLARVIENLIDNAIKYRGSKSPTVHMSVEESDARWQFSVRDNGIGIDPEFHEQVFDIFRRLHSDDDYKGTGIGLAICRRVIAHHGGSLWLESEAGQGSTFHFTLPKH
jgi:PAS domain S-box-containing protein